MFNRNSKPKYNQQMMNRAMTSAGLRVIVAGYIIFVAIKLISGTRQEGSSISPVLGGIIGAFFIACAAGFIIYSVRSFLKALQNARLDESESGESPAPRQEQISDANMSIAEKVRSAQEKLKSEEHKE